MDYMHTTMLEALRGHWPLIEPGTPPDEAQRVAAEQYDAEGMVRAIAQMQTQQTAVSAALQSYASIQKLSLLNYIS